MALTAEQVFECIKQEREFQKQKWGEDRTQSIPGYLLVARKELEEAEDGWLKNKSGRHGAMSELVQTAAVIFACLEEHGILSSLD